MANVRRLIPLLAFCLYFTKLFFQPPTLIDSSILLILAAISAYFEYKNSEKQIRDLEQKFSKLEQDLEFKTKEIDLLKSSVASIKFGNSLRPTAGSR